MLSQDVVEELEQRDDEQRMMLRRDRQAKPEGSAGQEVWTLDGLLGGVNVLWQ